MTAEPENAGAGGGDDKDALVQIAEPKGKVVQAAKTAEKLRAEMDEPSAAGGGEKAKHKHWRGIAGPDEKQGVEDMASNIEFEKNCTGIIDEASSAPRSRAA